MASYLIAPSLYLTQNGLTINEDPNIYLKPICTSNPESQIHGAYMEPTYKIY